MQYEDKDGLSHLIEKEINSNDKILKPDFSQKTGREFMALYLQTKFSQLKLYDTKAHKPLFISIKPNFVQKFSQRLISNPDKKIMICITGESASGKSTMCKAVSNIIESFNMPVTILSTDNYFKDISSLIKKYGSFDALRDNGYDIDSPQSFQNDILEEDLQALSRGEDIYSPEYLPNGTGISVPKSKFVPANKLILVEGIATMYEGVKDIFDIKLYVETTQEVRKARFLKRASAERNQDIENAQKHWNYVIGAGEKYVKPARQEADIILNGDIDIEYFSGILEYIHAITNNFVAE
ncbi:MAG: hypothetical protein MJ231_08310 [bacterium]|nr:hypothetical protein [bacterium]